MSNMEEILEMPLKSVFVGEKYGVYFILCFLHALLISQHHVRCHLPNIIHVQTELNRTKNHPCHVNV